jgi:hypothetical protein
VNRRIYGRIRMSGRGLVALRQLGATEITKHKGREFRNSKMRQMDRKPARSMEHLAFFLVTHMQTEFI